MTDENGRQSAREPGVSEGTSHRRERERERKREKEATCAGTQANKCIDSTPDIAAALGMYEFWARQVALILKPARRNAMKPPKRRKESDCHSAACRHTCKRVRRRAGATSAHLRRRKDARARGHKNALARRRAGACAGAGVRVR